METIDFSSHEMGVDDSDDLVFSVGRKAVSFPKHYFIVQIIYKFEICNRYIIII